MSDTSDDDLLKMFMDSMSENESKLETKQYAGEVDTNNYPYGIAHMTWGNPTLFTGRLILDSHNKYIRVIRDAMEIKLKDIDPTIDLNQQDLPNIKDRRVRLAPITEFKIQLTEDQIKLYNEVLSLVESYRETCPDDSCVRDRRCINLFYMVITAFKANEDEIVKYTPTKATLMEHISSRFVNKFNEAQRNKNQEMELIGEDQKWVLDYIKRSVGPTSHMIRINTSRDPSQGFGYNIEVSFFEVKKDPVEITQEILDSCADLNAEWFDSTTFDTEYYTKLRDQLKKLTDTGNIVVETIPS